jgi:hypothetical protein
MARFLHAGLPPSGGDGLAGRVLFELGMSAAERVDCKGMTGSGTLIRAMLPFNIDLAK